MTPSGVYRLECLQRARDKRVGKARGILLRVLIWGGFGAALYAIVRGGLR